VLAIRAQGRHAQASRITHRDRSSPFDLEKVEKKWRGVLDMLVMRKEVALISNPVHVIRTSRLDAISKKQKTHCPRVDPCNTKKINQLFQVAAITFPV
jgi:hypothetical protein